MSEGTHTTATPNVVSLGNIRGFGKSDMGVFKMSGDLFGWKNRKTGTVYQYKSSDINKAEWIKTGPNLCQLKVYLGETKKHAVARFDGFQDKDFREISGHFEKHLKHTLTRGKTACRGWHWGDYKFNEKIFTFSVDGRAAYEVGAHEINQIAIPTKTDIAIELQQEETGPSDVQLLEIRFYMPPKGDTDEVESQLDAIKQELTTSTGVDTKAESVIMLTDVHLLVPRGRYEIDLGRKALKFHGKSYDYTVQYKNITRMLLVPKPNSPHVVFVLGLDNAMRQGQTRYPFVVMQFESEAVTSVKVNLSDGELENLKLEKELEGKLCDVVTRLFGALVGRSIVVPGDFKSANDASGLTCSYRAASGHLYPLNRSLLFIVKPVIFIRYDDVLGLQFSRISQNRYFSFTVSVKGGLEYEFTSIDRNEYQPLTDFLQSKGLRVKNIQEVGAAPNDSLNGANLPSDESDEDFNEDESDEEYGGEGDENDMDNGEGKSDDEEEEDDDEGDEDGEDEEEDEEPDTKKSRK